MFDWFWEFLYALLKSILFCIDFIMDCAKMLMGIEPVYHEDTEVELLGYFFSSEEILNAFSYVALIGIVLLFLFTIFSVLRSVARVGEGKTPLGVCMDAAKQILYFLLLPAIMIMASYFVSAVMTSVYRATANGSVNIGATIFTAVADEACDYSGSNKEQIMQYFREGVKNYDYYSTGNVDAYFSLKEINYFIGYVAGFTVLFLLIKPLLTFVERIISLLLLFIVSPISVASAVLDDGKRFKLWREQVINKFLIAYGALIAINIYAILVILVQDITFFPNSSFLNGLARLLFILGGALACRMGTVLIGNIVNVGAGSQYAADMANLNGSFRAGAGFIGGMGFGAASAAVGTAAGAAKGGIMKAFNAATGKGSSSGSGSNGGSFGGLGNKDKRAEGPSHRFTDRVGKTGVSAGGGMPSSGMGGMSQKGGGQNVHSVLMGGHRAPGGVAGGSHKQDDALNRQSADTLKDAMKNNKTQLAKEAKSLKG